MTVTMTATTNLRTSKRRVYIDGKRVSESRFNEYRAIGCFFSESNTRVRRAHAVGVKKWWAS
jgi:hypothetical protein